MKPPSLHRRLRAVVRRSGLAALAGAGVTVVAETWLEDFATDPFARGWQATGNTNLFR